MEFLTVIFALFALLAPLVVPAPAQPPESVPVAVDWSVHYGYFWPLAIVALYIVHYLNASATIDYISTPFTHLISPFLFAAAAYLRLLVLGGAHEAPLRLARGTWAEAVLYFAVVTGLTLLFARLRMKRALRKFAALPWIATARPHVDSSFLLQGLLRIKPFFYWPLRYRIGAEGILVEGWHYLMNIPFREIKSITECAAGDPLTAGFYAATSSHQLLRIELYDDTVPIFISPQHSYRFLQEIQRLLYGKASVDPWKEQAEQDA